MTYKDETEEIFSSDISSFLKTVCYLTMLAIVIGVVFLILGCFRISSFAFNTYESIDKIPHNRVGLLLGTSSLNANGEPNEFFTYRIMAASQLFKAGKIEYILVSGDNQQKSYNEPRQMTRALIKAGVPADRIVSDYAGFSTLDSVIRARKVFLQKRITVISQDFQNERALFIASSNNIKAVGFNALSPDYSIFSKVSIRELLARIKCTLDVYIFKTQPTYLGEPLRIGKSAMPKEPSNKPKNPTSALKRITDNAKILRQQEEIAKFEPVSKKISDNAKILHEKMKVEMFADETIRPIDSNTYGHQQQVLKEEQNEAMMQANEVASESLNLGTGTNYIDPNEKIKPIKKEKSDFNFFDTTPDTDTQNTEFREHNGNARYHGDPWD